MPRKVQKTKTHPASFPGPEHLAGESRVLVHLSPFTLLLQPLIMRAAIQQGKLQHSNFHMLSAQDQFWTQPVERLLSMQLYLQQADLQRG